MSDDTIGKWINGKFVVVEDVLTKTGENLSGDVSLHLKSRETKRDDIGRPIYETTWIMSPVVGGKRIPSKTLRKTVDSHFYDLQEEMEPIVHDIYEGYTDVSLTRAARLAEYDDPKRFIDRFNRAKSKSYERVIKERDFTIFTNMEGVTDEYRRKSYNIIDAGINQNKNADTLVRELREDVFGLKKGEKNKGITSRCRAVVNTELSYAESEAQREIINQNPDIIGVRIHYYGGPCSGNVCPNILKRGRNVKFSGNEISADFYFGEDEVRWPPYHPRCFCLVIRYLYERDRLKLVGGKQPYETLTDKDIVEEPIETLTDKDIINIETKAKKEIYEEAQIIEDTPSVPTKPVNLTDLDKDVIKEYTGSGYKVNKLIRDDLEINERGKEFIKNLDTSLEKLPSYKGESYRVVSFRDQEKLNSFLSQHQPGNIVNYNSYTSTSRFEKSAITWEEMGGEKVHLKIFGEKGKDISKWSVFDTSKTMGGKFKENEILFKRDSKFIVKNIKTIDGERYIELVER